MPIPGEGRGGLLIKTRDPVPIPGEGRGGLLIKTRDLSLYQGRDEAVCL